MPVAGKKLKQPIRRGILDSSYDFSWQTTHCLTFVWRKQTLVLTLPGSVTWYDKWNVIEKPDLICTRNILVMFFSFQVWRLKIQELIRNLEARKWFVLNLFDIDILIKRPIVLFAILLTRKFQIDKLLSLLLLKIINIIYGYYINYQENKGIFKNNCLFQQLCWRIYVSNKNVI